MNGRGFNRVQFGDALTDSRRLLKGSKTALLIGSIAITGVAVLAVLLAGALAPGVLSTDPSLLDNLLINLISATFSAPLVGGFTLMSLVRARGGDISPAMLFSGISFATRFLVFGLITTAVSLLFSAFPWPFNQLLWLVLSALLSFTAYFIVDRDVGVTDAMGLSMRLVASNPGAVLGWLALSVVLTIAGVITFGIGLIWAVPYIFLLSATVYHLATAAGPDELLT